MAWQAEPYRQAIAAAHPNTVDLTRFPGAAARVRVKAHLSTT
jgi:hypothetical protein